ncbi:MAG: putative metal-binding motif-containing protein [Sandaracinaceae bacterium]|nr:putative metal-binding motif-containing protein [Sandaracinaceae bacterium]
MGTSGPNCGTDCDDTTIRRRSGQVEFCDSTDNDCDGRPMKRRRTCPGIPSPYRWRRLDGHGHGQLHAGGGPQPGGDRLR